MHAHHTLDNHACAPLVATIECYSRQVCRGITSCAIDVSHRKLACDYLFWDMFSNVYNSACGLSVVHWSTKIVFQIVIRECSRADLVIGHWRM